MSWRHLATCKWRSVTFQVVSIEDQHERRLVEFEYPYRDGADHADMGRRPRPTRFTAVFMGSSYETDLGALLLEVHTGRAGTFTHPLFGSWQARVKSLTVRHEASARDSAEVDLEVIETGTGQTVEASFSIEALSDQVTEASTALSTAWAAVQGATAAATAKIADVRAKAAAVQAAVDDAVTLIDRKMNDLRRVVASTVKTVESLHPANVAGRIRTRCQVLVRRCDQVAEAAKLSKPQVVQHEQRVEGPAVLLAFQYTGNADNLDAILEMNRVRNPLRIAAGDRIATFRQDPEE